MTTPTDPTPGDLDRLTAAAVAVRESIAALDWMYRTHLPAGSLVYHRGLAVCVVSYFPVCGRVMVEPAGGGPVTAVPVGELHLSDPPPSPEPTEAAAHAA